MMINFISEADKENARSIALRNLARFFSIDNWETKSNDELLQDLKSLTTEPALSIIKLLNSYFKAYDKWFNFYEQKRKIVKETGEEYYLNNEEKEMLGELIKKREDTLNELQQEFDELQLKRFNREKFGKNINGIIDSEK